MNRSIPSLFLVLAALAPAAAHAQTFEGPRPMALGGAYRATASGNEAIYYNPAGLSLYQQRYNMDMGWTCNPEGWLNVFNGSIVDSVSSPPLGAGLGFTYYLGNTVTPEKTELKGYRLDLAFSYPLSRQILWGVDGKFVNLDINKRSEAIYAVTADMGVIWLVSKFVRAAAVGHNLVPISRPELPVQSAVGMSFGRDTGFQAAVDAVVNYLSKDNIVATYHAGLEFMAGDILALRVGYTFDQVMNDNQFITTGIGIVAPRMGIDFGFKQNMTVTDDRYFSLVLRIFAG